MDIESIVEAAKNVMLLIGPEAVKSGVKRITEKVIDYSTSHASKLQDFQLAISDLAAIQTEAGTLSQVKTILHIDSTVDLSSFYVPTTVNYKTPIKENHNITRHHNVTRQIDDLDQMSFARCILIQGIAGQGKSSFLRYLAIRELAKGNKLPALVELRRIHEPGQLESLIVEEVHSLGVNLNTTTLHELCKDERITIFLDAFDEVAQHLRLDLLAQVESLIRRHKGLRVIMSSRFDSGASASNYFHAVAICPVAKGKHGRYIIRYSATQDAANRLIDGIKGSTIEHVLSTPLMIAILVVLYRTNGFIPADEPAFYSELFTQLIRRHDGAKAPFTRERHYKHGDNSLRRVFSAASYFAKQHEPGYYSGRQLFKIIERALKICGQPEQDAEAAIHDIVHVTNLLQRDGDEYRYIHRTVMEYFCAELISELPEELAQKFYTKRIKSADGWEVEMRFLRELDPFKYTKYYQVPCLETFANVIKAFTTIPPARRNSGAISEIFSLLDGPLGIADIQRTNGTNVLVRIGAARHGRTRRIQFDEASPADFIIYAKEYGETVDSLLTSGEELKRIITGQTAPATMNAFYERLLLEAKRELEEARDRLRMATVATGDELGLLDSPNVYI